MNYKLLDIDPIEQTMVIQWEDGLVLNHRIRVDKLLEADEQGNTRNQNGDAITIDDIIKAERPDVLPV